MGNLFQASDEYGFHKSNDFNSIESEIVFSTFFCRLHDIFESSTVYITFPTNRTKRYEHSLEVLVLYKKLLNDLTSYANVESNIEKAAVEKTTVNIVDEIFDINKLKDISKKESAIIVFSPVNDAVLKYLSENPESFYQLTDNDFEIVMAEIYSKLGYDVTRTKATRDGGKDLILRIPEVLGDFIYYVECKKYAAKRPIGVGVIRNLVGTVNSDRVNGGILATTSFFTRDAYEFISDNKWNCQIKTHDYNVIRDLLNQVV